MGGRGGSEYVRELLTLSDQFFDERESKPIKGVLFRLADDDGEDRVVKVTREEIECDICGKTGERYTVSYPDGIKILDRCETHAKKVLGLKNEAGGWSALGGEKRRGRLSVLTLDQIEEKRKKG